MIFPFETSPAKGEFLSPAPGILWAQLPTPFQLDHVNVYLVADDDGWAVIEAGAHIVGARECWNSLLQSLPHPRRITRIIVTHSHPDHVGGARFLCDLTGAPLVMTRVEYDTAVEMLANAEADKRTYRSFFQRHGLNGTTADGILSVSYDFRVGMEELPVQCEFIADGDPIRIGTRRFRVVTGSGHSPELAMLLDVENDVMICGDQILARISPNVGVLAMHPEHDPLGNYLTSLARIKERVPDTVLLLPGHELPFSGLHERIDELTGHHEDRCAAIEDACRDSGLTASELVPHVFGRTFPESQLGFAICETVAHINCLLNRHRLTEDLSGGKSRYRTIA